MSGALPLRILLVEDEVALATTILIALRSMKIESADHVKTLAEAEAALAQKDYELILLDRMLPDGDGLTLCRKLRGKRPFRGGILMLTALGSLEDRVEGLEDGADDYLPKPFALPELRARIIALSRRITARTPSKLWHLDREQLRILGPNGWITLTPLEYKLANHLISASGGIVSREELLKEVWGFRFLPKTRTVDYFMGRLRKNFELDADQPRHFLTVRGAGYRFKE